jgi:hypothetical protein
MVDASLEPQAGALLERPVVLVIYLVVHVWRRRKRLWRSTIR